MCVAQLIPRGVGLVEDPHLEVTGLVTLICSHIYRAVLEVSCVCAGAPEGLLWVMSM